MKLFLTLCFLLVSLATHAQVLRIGPGGYASLQAAASHVRAGDTVMYTAGTHAAGSYVHNLHGTADKWIVIRGPEEGEARISGGFTALQLSDPAYVRIEGLIFEKQTANGVNIDDAGSWETPAMHIVIENCEFRDIDARGNNDLLKMSGVVNFVIRNCVFSNGSPGGSMVDMVGCHRGLFEDNVFSNGGSNSIQAKGGSSDILITRNQFIEGGLRSLNIGGSTDPLYFRPPDANYEAARIRIHANVFYGGMAPFAFVGAVQCDASNNTVLYPDKWVIRILQETTLPWFLLCGDNSFRNNIVVVDNRAVSPSVNIGPTTDPESFVFANNLWYNSEQPSWQGPALPSTESAGLRGRNPLLRDIAMMDLSLEQSSPAIAAGIRIDGLSRDFLNMRYNDPPSIGAIEGNPLVSSLAALPDGAAAALTLWPLPARDVLHIAADAAGFGSDVALMYNLRGQLVRTVSLGADAQGRLRGVEALGNLAAGVYVIRLASRPWTAALLPVLR
jgi:hypothetical protein